MDEPELYEITTETAFVENDHECMKNMALAMHFQTSVIAALAMQIQELGGEIEIPIANMFFLSQQLNASVQMYLGLPIANVTEEDMHE